MKIMLLTHEYPPIGGGGATLAYFLAREFALKGHSVRVLTARIKGTVPFEQDRGVEVFRINALRISRMNPHLFELAGFCIFGFLKGLPVLNQYRPDVVQAVFGLPAGLVAWTLTRIRSVPYVVYIGGSDVPGIPVGRFEFISRLTVPIVRQVWRDSKAVIACSKGIRQIALRTAPDFPIDVIPDGVDWQKFQEKVGGAHTNREVVKILTVGRIVLRKGFQDLLESLPLLKEGAHRDFHLQIVGEGPIRPQLERLAKKKDMEDKVEFVGAVNYERLRELYQEADVFVLPSLAEGMPCTILEAMACGLPVIATNVQGNEELIQDGVNGFLVRPSEPRELGQALIKMVNDADRARRMGEQARIMSKRYDWKGIAASYLAAYEKLINK